MCTDNVTYNFHPYLNMLIGANGTGKVRVKGPHLIFYMNLKVYKLIARVHG